jgi:hypothetical protein
MSAGCSACGYSERWLLRGQRRTGADKCRLPRVALEHIEPTVRLLFVVISQLEPLRANWLERAAVPKNIPAQRTARRRHSEQSALFPPRPPLSAQQPTFIVATHGSTNVHCSQTRTNQRSLWPEIIGVAARQPRWQNPQVGTLSSVPNPNIAPIWQSFSAPCLLVIHAVQHLQQERDSASGRNENG